MKKKKGRDGLNKDGQMYIKRKKQVGDDIGEYGEFLERVGANDLGTGPAFPISFRLFHSVCHAVYFMSMTVNQIMTKFVARFDVRPASTSEHSFPAMGR